MCNGCFFVKVTGDGDVDGCIRDDILSELLSEYRGLPEVKAIVEAMRNSLNEESCYEGHYQPDLVVANQRHMILSALLPRERKKINLRLEGNWWIITATTRLSADTFVSVAQLVKKGKGEYVCCGGGSHFRIPKFEPEASKEVFDRQSKEWFSARENRTCRFHAYVRDLCYGRANPFNCVGFADFWRHI